MSLVRSGFIPIPPGAKRGFDHADVFAPGRRMYVAHTGADRIDVLDCATRSYLHALPTDLPGVAGVLIDEQDDLLFSSDRGVARVSVFRCSDEQLLGQVDVGPHPNGLAYDRKRRRLYSFNLGEPLGENCTTSVVALESTRVIAELPLPGRPRWAVYDQERDRVYANIQTPAQIVVIDCERAAIVHAFDVPSDGPHGLWLDAGRLFCAADGGALVVFERDSGDVLTTLPLPGVPDVVMHDAEDRRLYVAIGDPGVVCSFDSERLESLETIDPNRAHTRAAGIPSIATCTSSARQAAAPPCTARSSRMSARAISAALATAAAALALLASGCGHSSGHLPLRLVRDIRLPGAASRFDYQSIDEQRHRLYIAHLGAGQIVVYDLNHGAVARVIDGVPGVHGVLVVPRSNRLYATATSRHELVTYAEQPPRVLGRVKAGIFPDGIAYDPRDHEAFVSDEAGDWEAVVDARNGRLLRRIPVGGDAGNVQYDPSLRRALVDVGERDQLALINPQTLRVVRTIQLPGCDHDHGLHLDPPRRLAFITCDANNKLLVLDLRTMKIVQTASVGKRPDVLDFDPRRHLLYVAAESGVVAVFAEKGSRVEKLGQGFLAAHAHSVAVDPRTGYIYFPLENVAGHPVLRVMRPRARR